MEKMLSILNTEQKDQGGNACTVQGKDRGTVPHLLLALTTGMKILCEFKILCVLQGHILYEEKKSIYIF